MIVPTLRLGLGLRFPGPGPSFASTAAIVATGPVYTTDFTALSALPTGVSLSRATTGTRTDSTGTRQTAAIDAARFDYAYNGSLWVPKGFLNEGQRTNLLKDSGDQTTTNYGRTQVATTTSSQLGADNSSFMTLVTAAANGVTHVTELYNNVGVAYSAGTNAELSVDFKKTNWNYIYVSFQTDATGNWVTAVVDLSTNSITETVVGANSGTVVSTPPVEVLRDGIVRLKFIAKHNGSNGYMTIGFAQQATGNSFQTGGGGAFATTPAGTETFLVNASQISPGTSPTSYIPTTTAAVTRSADIPSSSSPLTAYLAAGPSVWEFQDEATGTIARTAYAAGAFDWPVNKWYRSMGVYAAGTDTSGHMTVGSAY